jgi:hypothetical protein
VPKERILEAVREASIPDHAHAKFQTLLRAGEDSTSHSWNAPTR